MSAMGADDPKPGGPLKRRRSSRQETVVLYDGDTTGWGRMAPGMARTRVSTFHCRGVDRNGSHCIFSKRYQH
jgi:hypothetical protein